MDYHDAPATKMLQITCAICGEDLLDAKSVEYGMGPTCRSKHGFMGKNAPQVSDQDRKKANRIIHSIASGLPGEHLGAAIKELREMGFTLLAATLEDRKCAVRVEGHDITTLAVRFPFNMSVVDAIKARVPGRRWNKEEKAWLVPATTQARTALWEILKSHFAGEMMMTESGVKQIPFSNGGRT
jgi:Family of unknown function (DUF6011)